MYYPLTSSISNGLLALYWSNERTINTNTNTNVGSVSQDNRSDTCVSLLCFGEFVQHSARYFTFFGGGGGVSDFVLIGIDIIQSQFLSIVTILDSCTLFRLLKQNKGVDTSNQTRSEKLHRPDRTAIKHSGRGPRLGMTFLSMRTCLTKDLLRSFRR